MLRPALIWKLFRRSAHIQKKRMAMTVAAIAWGTLTIVLLLSFGEGLKRTFSRGSKGLGEGIVVVWANTTAKALRLAAELVEAGADVHRVFQGVYENVAFAKLKLVARALENAQVFEGGRVVVSHLERSDFEASGAEEPYSEGIIDYLRAVEGAEIAALIREPPTQNGPKRRVSLRTTAEDLDVSAIARKSGGGGHPQAAGFSSEASVEEIIEFIRREFLAQVNGQSASG